MEAEVARRGHGVVADDTQALRLAMELERRFIHLFKDLVSHTNDADIIKLADKMLEGECFQYDNLQAQLDSVLNTGLWLDSPSSAWTGSSERSSMNTTIRLSSSIGSSFVAKVEKISGQKLLACYQCGKCSAGCPMAAHMDILPNQIIRMAQLGMQKQLLASRTHLGLRVLPDLQFALPEEYHGSPRSSNRCAKRRCATASATTASISGKCLPKRAAHCRRSP